MPAPLPPYDAPAPGTALVPVVLLETASLEMLEVESMESVPALSEIELDAMSLLFKRTRSVASRENAEARPTMLALLNCAEPYVEPTLSGSTVGAAETEDGVLIKSVPILVLRE